MRFLLLVVLLNLLGELRALESANDTNYSIFNAENITKPGCQQKCGNVTVPYPFGIVSEQAGLNCSLAPYFDVTCDNSQNPPKALLTNNYKIYDISNSELRITNMLIYTCYNDPVTGKSGATLYRNSLTAFAFSDANVLTVTGCDDTGNIYDVEDSGYPKGCSTTCRNPDEVITGSCTGSGCCQVSINLRKFIKMTITSFSSHENVSSFDRCGHAFFGEKSRFKFRGTTDLKDGNFGTRIDQSVPVLLDWFIGEKNCNEAPLDLGSYACKYPNSECVNGTGPKGYRCRCKEGYEGNPYLAGCNDIDECQNPQQSGCKHICHNTLGGYNCSCKPGYRSQGKYDCIRPTSNSQQIKF